MALLGIELAERLNDRFALGNCNHVYALFTSHWHRPLLAALPFARRAFSTLLECGDLQMAGYTFFDTLAMLYESGSPLTEVAAEADRALHFVRKTNNRHARRIRWR
jgi:hypothetical protein